MDTLGSNGHSAVQRIMQQKRRKIFGKAQPCNLNDAEKRAILANARKLRREPDKAAGAPTLTRTAVDVLAALLWRFHNRSTGLCYPSYEAIAKAAGCAVSSISPAIQALEAAGILTWANRLVRRAVSSFSELLEQAIRIVVPQRSSNSYTFTHLLEVGANPRDKNQSGTRSELLFSCEDRAKHEVDGELERSLSRLRQAMTSPS